MLGGHALWATPGGVATDLVILASSLLALAGLLFIGYVVAVVASITYGTIRGPLPHEAAHGVGGAGQAGAAVGDVVGRAGATATPGPDRVSSTEDGGL